MASGCASLLQNRAQAVRPLIELTALTFSIWVKPEPSRESKTEDKPGTSRALRDGQSKPQILLELATRSGLGVPFKKHLPCSPSEDSAGLRAGMPRTLLFRV